MNKFKEYTSYILIFLSIILFYIWMINYERNTAKILQDIDREYQENIVINDILVVPEKSIDYWEETKFEINWYTKGEQNDRKSNKTSKSTTRHITNNKSNNSNRSNMLKLQDNTLGNKNNIQVNIIHDKVDSYNISMDIITNYIKEKEGFNSRAYKDGCLVKAKKCPSNKIRYSNGYGTIAKSKNEVITVKEAEKRLNEHIKKTIYPNLKNVKFKNKQQIYASIDFAYNIGHNAFRNNIVNENMEVDCAKMTKYVVFNGKENEGLKQRRFENFIQCVSIEDNDLTLLNNK